MTLNNPIADITHLASSTHTTREILRARLHAVAKSLPQVPETVDLLGWSGCSCTDGVDGAPCEQCSKCADWVDHQIETQLWGAAFPNYTKNA